MEQNYKTLVNVEAIYSFMLSDQIRVYGVSLFVSIFIVMHILQEIVYPIQAITEYFRALTMTLKILAKNYRVRVNKQTMSTNYQIVVSRNINHNVLNSI